MKLGLESRQMLTVLTFLDAQTVAVVDGSRTSAAFADVAGDGAVDIVSFGAGLTEVHTGDGHNSFREAETVVSNGQLLGISDIDSDGSKDLVFGQIADMDSAFFRWYKKRSRDATIYQSR